MSKPVYTIERDHRIELMKERANGRLNGIKECNDRWLTAVDVLLRAAVNSRSLTKLEVQLLTITLNKLRAKGLENTGS